MSGGLHHNHSLMDAIAKIIELPPRLVAFDLRVRQNEIPTVTATFYPTAKVIDGPVTKHFTLTAITEPGPGTAQPPQGPST